MKFSPTKEQLDFFNEVKNGTGNILIQAYAGCSKTTSAIESLKYTPENTSKIFLAFNKHIRDELKEKLPDGVKTNTLHSIGYGAILRKYKDVEFDPFKIDKIIQRKKNKWNLETEFKNDQFKIDEYLMSIKKMVDLCKLTLTMKKEFVPYLCDRYGVKYSSNSDIKRIFMVLEESFNDKKSIDFNDMVFLPAYDNKIFLIQYDYIYVDEIQDLNKAQQIMVDKMIKRDRKSGLKTGRLILIGDKFQTIYAFTGVSDKSFEWYENIPNTKKMKLSTTFRCGKKIVEEAQKYAPELKAMDTAIDGVVRHDGDCLKEAESGDFILCRTTMPLVKLFFHFLVQNKKAIIKGSDIGDSLKDMTKGFNNIDEMKKYWENNLINYADKLKAHNIIDLKSDTGYAALEDKVITLLFISKLSQNIEDLKIKINAIFSDESEGIILSTVHKSKGLEADRVFIIRPDQLPMKRVTRAWEKQQEDNLTYVAITRARKELIYDYNFNEKE